MIDVRGEEREGKSEEGGGEQAREIQEEDGETTAPEV